jgi:hypothetical protein
MAMHGEDSDDASELTRDRAAPREHFVVSEHEGKGGERYYRMSCIMELKYCEDRARRMVEEEGAISATIGKATARVERRVQSVRVDPVRHADSMLSGGQMAGFGGQFAKTLAT